MIKTCPICRKEFKAEEHKRKYCSHACNNRSRIKDKTKLCSFCGNSYQHLPGNKRQQYCSTACRHKSLVKHRFCKQCGSEIESRGKKKNFVFCSHQCLVAYTKENAYVQHCKNCGDVILLRTKGSPFCSRACYLKYKGETSIERRVREELERRGITFKSQHQIGLYVADFYLPVENLIIEADGAYWHSSLATRRKDERRDAFMQSQGLTVLRLQEANIKDASFISIMEGALSGKN